MKWALSVFIVLFISLLYAPPVHAVIFLPAIVLIPIVKIIALIIGGFSLPALGVGAIWSKFFGKSLRRTITIIVVILVAIAIILAVFLKLHNPDRPLF